MIIPWLIEYVDSKKERILDLALASLNKHLFFFSRIYVRSLVYPYSLVAGTFAYDAVETRTREHTDNMVNKKRNVARLVFLEAFYNK